MQCQFYCVCVLKGTLLSSAMPVLNPNISTFNFSTESQTLYIGLKKNTVLLVICFPLCNIVIYIKKSVFGLSFPHPSTPPPRHSSLKPLESPAESDLSVFCDVNEVTCGEP